MKISIGQNRFLAGSLVIAGLLGGAGCSRPWNGFGTSTTADADLKQSVETKLATDPQLARVDVSADANRNQVTLSGTVSSEQTRNQAVELAKLADPNASIIDTITVTPEAATLPASSDDSAARAREKAKALGDKIGDSLDDAWVYTKVEAKLVGHTAAPAFKINVDVQNNVVTLRGVVPNAEMKKQAEQLAWQTQGVRAVRNLLEVRA